MKRQYSQPERCLKLKWTFLANELVGCDSKESFCLKEGINETRNNLYYVKKIDPTLLSPQQGQQSGMYLYSSNKQFNINLKTLTQLITDIRNKEFDMNFDQIKVVFYQQSGNHYLICRKCLQESRSMLKYKLKQFKGSQSTSINIFGLNIQYVSKAIGKLLGSVGQSLAYLTLSRCKLVNIQNLPKWPLQYLDLSFNELGNSQLVVIARYNSLHILDLKYNRFSNHMGFIKQLQTLSNLTDLQIINNNFSMNSQESNDFINYLFKSFKNLRTVDSFNSNSSTADQIQKLLTWKYPFKQHLSTSLKQISLHTINIGHLNQQIQSYLCQFRQCQNLELINCNLHSLKYFPAFSHLMCLNLTSNHLTDSDVQYIFDCLNLRYLCMNFNAISSISTVKSLKALKSLVFASFIANPVEKDKSYNSIIQPQKEWNELKNQGIDKMVVPIFFQYEYYNRVEKSDIISRCLDSRQSEELKQIGLKIKSSDWRSLLKKIVYVVHHKGQIDLNELKELVASSQKKIQQSQLPILESHYFIKPPLNLLKNMTHYQLSNVKGVTIANKYGKIQFETPINLFAKKVSQCVSIKPNQIQILDPEWNTNCTITYTNFANLKSLKGQRRVERQKDIHQWASQKGYKVVWIDPFNGNVSIKVSKS